MMLRASARAGNSDVLDAIVSLLWPVLTYILRLPYRLVFGVLDRWPMFTRVIILAPLLLLACVCGWLLLRRYAVPLAYRSPKLAIVLNTGWQYPAVALFASLSLLFHSALLAPYPAILAAIAPYAFYVRAVGASCFYAAGAALYIVAVPKPRRSVHLGKAAWAALADVRPRADAPFVLPVDMRLEPGRSTRTLFCGSAALAPAREQVRRHIRLLGASGSGKGYYVLGHLMATARTPYISQDVKAECPNMLRRWHQCKRPPILWGCARPDGWPSLSWNPLQETYDDPDFEDACAALAAGIIKAEEGQNAIFADTARRVLRLIIESRAYSTLGAMQADIAARGLMPVLEAIHVGAGIVESLGGKNSLQYANNNLLAALENFSTGWAAKVTSEHCFSLQDVLERDTYVLSAETQETRRAPLQLFWRMLLRKMLQADQLSTMLLLDEGLAAGRLPNLADALNTLRSKGAMIVFSYQNSGGGKALYREEWDGIQQAFTNSITLLSGLNAQDLEDISRQAGKFTYLKGRPGVKKEEREGELLSVDAAGRLAAARAKWALIRIPELTSTGRPILARCMPSTFRVDEPDEVLVDALRRAYPPRVPSIRPEAPTVVPNPEPTPEPGSAPVVPVPPVTDAFGL